MAMHQENLGAALALAAAGIRIFPAGQDKRPLLKGWQEAATCNADQINEWWEHSTALPAIPCGQNGLLVIDCDRHGGPDGVEAFRKLVAANGGLPPDMPVVSTPSRGAHLYFKQPNGEALDNSRGTLPKAVDCRGSGGFVIGPGARLPDGRGWTAVAGRAPIHQAPPVPHWIEQILRPPQREEAREPNNSDETNEERGRAYAMAALDGVETELAAAPTGERNDRLYKTAFRLATMAARGWLMESEIIETLMRACEANQYLREHGHRATTKTIESGISDGLKVPHDDLEDRGDAERVETGAGTQQKQPRQEQRKQEERTQRQRETGHWDSPDLSIVDDRRGALPNLQLSAIPQTIHRWLTDAALGAGVTVDHIALPLIGIASGLIGVARRVQATRSWQQPMTCWACLVGLSGSGKTPSLDVVKRALSVAWCRGSTSPTARSRDWRHCLRRGRAV